ncbi:MAG: ferrous iron transporter B [Phycisphaerales bacterium]
MSESAGEHPTSAMRVALVGNPNTGKTTLFNALCGLRHKTGNFPGTTQEARIGRVETSDPPQGESREIHLIDLPGTYSLELAQSEAEICRSVLAGTLAPPGEVAAAPDAVLVVVDAANIERNLLLVGEVLRRRLPTVVALNMIDVARKRGAEPDAGALSSLLGCSVIACSARQRDGISTITQHLQVARVPNVTPPGTQEGLEEWAHNTFTALARQAAAKGARVGLREDALTDRVDRILTHPVLGLLVFAIVMFALFYSIFRVAEVPMGLIEAIFGKLTSLVKTSLPEGIISDFLAEGVIAGIGGTLVFLPQICLLFFIICLLEDTGYLARAAFLADRFLRPFGLSGNAFVPLLSSHACAIPGLMATRGIPDRKERLAAILVAPFMSCSARIPVYVLLTTLLFPGKPGSQALAFMSCYALGAAAGLFSSLVARRTILRGKSRAMVMELPTYKRPSLRTALLATGDRAMAFLKKAGTMILAISVVLWWLSSYPKVDAPPAATSLRQSAATLRESASREAAASQQVIEKNEAAATEYESQANALEASYAASNSFLGRLGRTVQPVFSPLGYDWKLTVGVLASFAAREVFASTMSIITTGSEDIEADGVAERIGSATRDDGVTPMFTPATSWSLLVYFVLAMQCLPTLAVTAKESGSAKWAALQLVWMCGLAYIAALIVYQVMK